MDLVVVVTRSLNCYGFYNNYLAKDLGHLCFIYQRQTGDRKLLLGVVPQVWNDTSMLIKSNTAVRSPLLRKYLLKLTQRIGLTCLPHRAASWHYMVSNEILLLQFLTLRGQ